VVAGGPRHRRNDPARSHILRDRAPRLLPAELTPTEAEDPSLHAACVVRGLRDRVVEQKPRERDAGDRRVEGILTGARRPEAPLQKAPDGVEIEPGVGSGARPLIARTGRERRIPERLPEVVAGRPLHAPEGVEGTLGRDVLGPGREFVEVAEPAGAEGAERLTERAKAGFRPILARDTDGAVERDDGVAGQLEGGDVLDGTRRRQNVATSAQHRPAQLAFARSRPPVDGQDLAGRPAKPAHPWRRRATTASS